MLFEDVAREYLEDKGKRLRATTMEGYESAIRRHLMPRWEGVDLEDVGPDDIQGWVDGFELPGAAEKAYKTLRQIIRWAIRRLRLRMLDPTSAGIDLPRKAPYRPRVLSAREEREMLRGVYGAPFEAVVLCAAALGLRRCEACALDWGDVDYRSGRVRVSRGAHVVGGEEVVTPPKTELSDRVLVLPPFALRRLRRLAAGRRRGRMCPMRPDQVARRFRSWCRRRGLPWVPMQSLRHSWATISIGAGVPLEDVSLCLGHSSQDTCYQHYLVRTDEICRRASRGYAGAVMGGQSSLSRMPKIVSDGISYVELAENTGSDQVLIFRISGSAGRYSLIFTEEGISLWDSSVGRSVWTLKGTHQFSLSRLVFGVTIEKVQATYNAGLSAAVLAIHRDNGKEYNLIIKDDGSISGLITEGQTSLSHIIIDNGGTFWVQLLQATNGMALVFRTNGLAGFGLSFDPDRKLFQIFDVDSAGKWQNASSITMKQLSLSRCVVADNKTIGAVTIGRNESNGNIEIRLKEIGLTFWFGINNIGLWSNKEGRSIGILDWQQLSLSQIVGYFTRRGSITVDANSTGFCDIDADVPDGYAPIGIVEASTGHGSVVLQGFKLMSGDVARVECRNVTGSSLSMSPQVKILALRASA